MSMVLNLASTVANDQVTLTGIDSTNASVKETLVTDGTIAGTKVLTVQTKSEQSNAGVVRVLVQAKMRLNVPEGAVGWSADGAWSEDEGAHIVFTIGPKLRKVLTNAGSMDSVIHATLGRCARAAVAVACKDNSISGVVSSAASFDVVKNAIVGASLVDTQTGTYGKSAS